LLSKEKAYEKATHQVDKKGLRVFKDFSESVKIK